MRRNDEEQIVPRGSSAPSAQSAIPRGSLSGFCVILALALGSPAIVAAQMDSLSAPLTASERDRLERGAFVERPTVQRRGRLHLVGGSSFQVIRRPPEEVWRALSDLGGLGNLLPNVAGTSVVAREGSASTVRIRHREGPINAAYHLRLRHSRNNTVVFQLDPRRKNDIHAGWGFVRIRPWNDDSATLVSYSVLVDVGPGLLKTALTPTFKEWILRVPLTMKWYLEGRGRARYRS